jgi:hypothetical protein
VGSGALTKALKTLHSRSVLFSATLKVPEFGLGTLWLDTALQSSSELTDHNRHHHAWKDMVLLWN